MATSPQLRKFREGEAVPRIRACKTHANRIAAAQGRWPPGCKALVVEPVEKPQEREILRKKNHEEARNVIARRKLRLQGASNLHRRSNAPTAPSFCDFKWRGRSLWSRLSPYQAGVRRGSALRSVQRGGCMPGEVSQFLISTAFLICNALRLAVSLSSLGGSLSAVSCRSSAICSQSFRFGRG